MANLQELKDQLISVRYTEQQLAEALVLERRALGIKYKALTPGPLRELIAERNIAKYGDELGPDLAAQLKSGKSYGEIIESSLRPGGGDIKQLLREYADYHKLPRPVFRTPVRPFPVGYGKALPDGGVSLQGFGGGPAKGGDDGDK